MSDKIEDLFSRLQKSKFRSSIKLGKRELNYLQDRGLNTVMKHGRDFINERIAGENPQNDGKQTPWRNHPVFIAQHATATCCRGCIEKWHKIPKGKKLSGKQVNYILKVLEDWLSGQIK